MRWRIRKCPRCGRYTLRDVCPSCGSPTVVAHPHRFSPEDRMVRYRVAMKYGIYIPPKSSEESGKT